MGCDLLGRKLQDDTDDGHKKAEEKRKRVCDGLHDCAGLVWARVPQGVDEGAERVVVVRRQHSVELPVLCRNVDPVAHQQQHKRRAHDKREQRPHFAVDFELGPVAHERVDRFSADAVSVLFCRPAVFELLFHEPQRRSRCWAQQRRTSSCSSRRRSCSRSGDCDAIHFNLLESHCACLVSCSRSRRGKTRHSHRWRHLFRHNVLQPGGTSQPALTAAAAAATARWCRRWRL